MYPKWVQLEGHSGTTAWSQDEENAYYASFKIGAVTETAPAAIEKRKPGRPRRGE